VIAVQTKFCKALFDPEDWSLPEATQAAETEWAREMGATAQTMSRDMFFDSLFEIVDVWTLEIDSNEYVQASPIDASRLRHVPNIERDLATLSTIDLSHGCVLSSKVQAVPRGAL